MEEEVKILKDLISQAPFLEKASPKIKAALVNLNVEIVSEGISRKVVISSHDESLDAMKYLKRFLKNAGAKPRSDTMELFGKNELSLEYDMYEYRQGRVNGELTYGVGLFYTSPIYEKLLENQKDLKAFYEVSKKLNSLSVVKKNDLFSSNSPELRLHHQTLQPIIEIDFMDSWGELQGFLETGSRARAKLHDIDGDSKIARKAKKIHDAAGVEPADKTYLFTHSSFDSKAFYDNFVNEIGNELKGVTYSTHPSHAHTSDVKSVASIPLESLMKNLNSFNAIADKYLKMKEMGLGSSAYLT